MEFSSENLSAKDNYKILTGIVVPRPIALVSTKNLNNIYNVAPFSFFNIVSTDPPIVMFSVNNRENQKKDTLANIESHPEFAINIISSKFMQEMHNSSIDFPPEIDEFKESNLTPIKAKTIDSILVSESLINLECVLEKLMVMGNNTLVFGRIKHYHIDEDIYFGDYKINVDALNPVARLAGNRYGLISNSISLKRKSYKP